MSIKNIEIIHASCSSRCPWKAQDIIWFYKRVLLTHQPHLTHLPNQNGNDHQCAFHRMNKKEKYNKYSNAMKN
jgi:hypothetical protein